MRMLSALVIAATAMACASIRPAPVQAGDLCLRCRRPIGDLRVAGEIIDNMRAPRPFRTAGCMAKYVRANGDAAFAAIFVTDYHSGKMIPASDAWFVPTTIPAPGGKFAEPDYYAFGSRAEAEAFKADTSRFMRWAQVVAAAE